MIEDPGKQFQRATARRLRLNETDAEARLWRRLRRFPVTGTHFRRQVPIGPYVADFVCMAARLIIEVDGSQHGDEARKAHDETRTQWFANRGYRVIRFWNNDISRNIDGVLEAIYAAVHGSPDAEPERLKHQRRKRARLHPTPLAFAKAQASDPPLPGEGEARALSTRIASAFLAACRDELQAPKPGNVHVFADGHRMTAAQFVASAEAAAPALTEPGARVGQRILGAVEATAAAVGTNTNLGIILLCAPLAAAAEEGLADLKGAVAHVLARLDIEDARLAFRAIVLAAPGGLGHAAQHDVHAPATVSLRAAMAAAADRDSIARQYVSGFAGVFAIGEAALQIARSRAFDQAAATLAVYLAFLSAFPDSHVARKHGLAVAEEVRRTALRLHDRLQAAADPSHLHDDLMAWDAALKAGAINPGTSADLTVATLFASYLRQTLPSARNND